MIEIELNPPESQLDEIEEYQRGISDGFGSTGKPSNMASRKSRRLYCFSCHRTENHYNTLKGKSYHYLLIGMTLGLVSIFGAYRCRCCGHRRLARYDFLNPRYHYHRWKNAGKFITGKRTVKPVAKRRTPNNGNMALGAASTNGQSNGTANGTANGEFNGETVDSNGSRRRRKRKLKAVPAVDSIGIERRRRKEQLQVEQATGNPFDFSIDSLVESLETKASIRLKAELAARERVREPLIARKAIPRKNLKGKPKRRYAKKERLTGPKLYCFGCKQDNQHFHRFKGTSIYFFLFGISLGLITIIGPFRCSVCTRSRFFRMNFLHPKYFIRRYLERVGDGYG